MWRGALVVVIVLAGAPARASERSARLVYTGTACSAADLAAQVIALFGRDPFSQDGELVVGVAVEAEPGIDVEPARVRATIQIPGARIRTRRLEAASCRELADALAFVIVMALAEPDPRASNDRKPAKRAGEVQERDSEVPFAAAGGPRRVRLDAITGGAASIRLRPQAYLGVRARRGWTSAALELAAELPDSFAAGIGRVTIDRASATLAPCVHRGPFAGCAALTAGVFRGRGEGFMDSRSALMPMAVAGARVAWERAVAGRLRLHLRGEAGVVLTRNRFLVDDEVVWSAERVEGRLGIGMLVRFP